MDVWWSAEPDMSTFTPVNLPVVSPSNATKTRSTHFVDPAPAGSGHVARQARPGEVANETHPWRSRTDLASLYGLRHPRSRISKTTARWQETKKKRWKLRARDRSKIYNDTDARAKDAKTAARMKAVDEADTAFFDSLEAKPTGRSQRALNLTPHQASRSEGQALPVSPDSASSATETIWSDMEETVDSRQERCAFAGLSGPRRRLPPLMKASLPFGFCQACLELQSEVLRFTEPQNISDFSELSPTLSSSLDPNLSNSPDVFSDSAGTANWKAAVVSVGPAPFTRAAVLRAATRLVKRVPCHDTQAGKDLAE